MRNLFIWCFLIATAPVFAQEENPGQISSPVQVSTPAQLYPELFKAVQMNRVFPDGKTFPDATPLRSAARINGAYRDSMNHKGFDVKNFVYASFRIPSPNAGAYKSDPGQTLRQHIDTLWSVLQRNPDSAKNSSLLSLPYPYIVPGGRFREIYYWDSYFTMLGLNEAKRYKLMRFMVANFAYLIDQYGHIPNGNRSYYLSRSQPPFFSLMVQLAAMKDKKLLIRYLPELIEEYAYWMKGSDHLTIGTGLERVVKMSNGSLLNRYFSDSDQPRDESYREDMVASATSMQHPSNFYRNVRAAAESGWDFSSRWFSDGKFLASIQTTDLIPVDLNCLLYNLEKTIEGACRAEGKTRMAVLFEIKAAKRKNAILHYCWNMNEQCFTDFNWKNSTLSNQVTIATAFPLFFGIADQTQGKLVAKKIQNDFLQPGGVSTTLKKTGQQWDRPNGWAPLQYVTITGLNRYGQSRLADTIAMRWIHQNIIAFKQSGKLLEKYDIELKGSAASAGGGEYLLQDGFGWTNGVLLTLMNEYHIP